MRTLSLVATIAALQSPLQANALDKAFEQRVSCPNPQMTDVKSAPASVTSRPSSTQVMPSARMTREWKCTHGSASSRAGT